MSDSSTKASNAVASRPSRDSSPPWTSDSRDRRLEASYMACDISSRSSSSCRFCRLSVYQSFIPVAPGWWCGWARLVSLHADGPWVVAVPSRRGGPRTPYCRGGGTASCLVVIRGKSGVAGGRIPSIGVHWFLMRADARAGTAATLQRAQCRRDEEQPVLRAAGSGRTWRAPRDAWFRCTGSRPPRSTRARWLLGESRSRQGLPGPLEVLGSWQEVLWTAAGRGRRSSGGSS